MAKDNGVVASEKNQIKDSLNERPLHPDAQDAYNAFVNFEDVERDLDPDF